MYMLMCFYYFLVNGKVFPIQTMKTYGVGGGSSSIAPLTVKPWH